MNTTPIDPVRVRAAWRELDARRLRQHDVAAALKLPEAQLLDCRTGADDEGPAVTRLDASRASLDAMLAALPGLGPVMALTRNEACVHEKDGRYLDVDTSGHAGLVLGPDIDLRLFLGRWRSAYAVRTAGPQGVQRSLQWFLEDGVAAHKLFLRPASDVAAYDALVARFALPEQAPGLAVEASPPAYPTRDDTDLEAFRAEWLAMTDTHEFFGLLRRHGLTRTGALRAAPGGHALRVPDDTVDRVLRLAADESLPIMVFVGNPGCIQIHTGPVRRIQRIGDWLNVLDEGFNLHLRTDAIAQSWWVRKPTADGPVTSLELFDRAGETIAMLFGERKPGRAELPAWTALAAAQLDGVGA